MKNDLLLTNNANQDPSAGIQVGSRRWYDWLANHPQFLFQGTAGHFTARRELRRGMPYWYAYRWSHGKLSKAYLGKSQELTQERLDQTSARLAGQKKSTRPPNSTNSIDWMTALNQPPTASIISSDQVTPDLNFLPLTKVRPPALPHKLVTRQRLTQRISSPITLLIAPSGFGKSTLLNEWRRRCGIPVAWVSLDADDNHPLRFWATITAALQTIYPNLGQDLQSPLQTASSADISETVIALSNAIVKVGETPDSAPRIGLVLDDYHHIKDKQIHASMQTWLEHFPSPLQLVIASHTRPPLSCGHLRVQGMIGELSTDDLRFTLEEGIGYLSQHARAQPLAFGDMQAIVKRTEGWAAGLALATLVLDQPGDRQQALGSLTGAHNYLREYFIESVLYRQPPSVQEFLFETAILKHLTGPLCDAVTGRNDGSEMLAYLWQENVFLVRMEEPNWYRYHDLFAETLCSQLQRQLATGIPRLHRRAAEWYRQQNAPDDAVYHLLAIEAWEEAASLIEDIVLRELEQFGDYSRLLRWLRQLPETVVQQHKTLLRVYARVASLDLSRTEVKQFLTRIESNITRKPVEEQSTEEQSVLAEIRRIQDLWVTGDHVLLPLSKDGEHEDVWQMLDGIVTYARYVRRDFEKAEKVSRELYDMSRVRSHLYVMLITGGSLAHYALLRGQIRRSEKIASEVLQQALAQRGKLPESASVALTILCRVCYERNQLAQAHQLLLRAAEVDPNPTSSNMPIMEAIQRAKIEYAQGDANAALATIQAARELQSKHPAGLYRDRDLVAYQAWFSVRQGDYDSAETLLSQVEASGLHAFSILIRAELLLKQGNAIAASDQVHDLFERYPYGLYLEPNLGARIVSARALFEQHQINRARQVMTDAVRLACPEGFVRPFLDYGGSSAPLLALVLNTANIGSETQSFVKQILHLLGNKGMAQKLLPDAELTNLSTAASITAREQQVLGLVAAGLSNREIAAQLSFAESTVKTHLKNIYRKLAVNSRTRAIAKAQTLKLA